MARHSISATGVFAVIATATFSSCDALSKNQGVFAISGSATAAAQISGANSIRRIVATGDWSSMIDVVNLRSGVDGPGLLKTYDALGNPVVLDKAQETNMEIVTKDGVRYFQSTIKDGDNWQNLGYDRTEFYPYQHDADGNNVPFLQAGHKYQFKWEGMYPQAMPTDCWVTLFFQVHENNGVSPAYEIDLMDGNLVFRDHGDPNHEVRYVLGVANDFVNVPLAMILTYVPSGTNGYVKFEFNGKTIMERTSGQTTATPGEDWPKAASMYDWGNCMVSPTSTLGRSYQLLTKGFELDEVE